MSVDRQHYCGPFLKCKIVRKLSRLPRNFKVCMAPGCYGYGKQVAVAFQFCPGCGAGLEADQVDVMVRAFDWFEEIGDSMLTPAHYNHKGSDDFDCLIPNDGGTPTRNRIPDEPEDQPFFLIAAEDVVEEKRKFSQHYAEVIKKAEELCGADGVEVAWGIVSYYI